MEKTLVQKLRRWAEIAEGTHEKANWDECSLLHSFGDQLARDLLKAAKIIENYQHASRWDMW